jgi:hypothetical protein
MLECIKKLGLQNQKITIEKLNGDSVVLNSLNLIFYSLVLKIKNKGKYCITIAIKK